MTSAKVGPLHLGIGVGERAGHDDVVECFGEISGPSLVKGECYLT